MAGVARRRNRDGRWSPEWRGWYFDRFRRRVFFKGFRSKRETLEVAQELEAKERKARLLGEGSNVRDGESFAAVVDAYIAWGNSEGGRGGRGWNKYQAGTRRRHLMHFADTLRWKAMGDMYGSLSDCERILRGLRESGLAPKSVAIYAESLKAFAGWAVGREFLRDNPVAKLKGGSREAVRLRRALTDEEFRRLYVVAPVARRVLYLVAVTTGYRAGELRALRVKDFDRDGGFLALPGKHTKNRKAALQPVPAVVGEVLGDFVVGKAGTDKLLSIPANLVRELGKDLEAAGIAKETSDGVLDFHSFRVTFVTWIAERATNPREVQELARHSTPNLTYGVYTRVAADRLRATVEGIVNESLSRRCAAGNGR